jgi:hypothetical protein
MDSDDDDDHKRIDGFRDRYRRIKRCRQVKRMAAGDILLGFTIPPAWVRDSKEKEAGS